eukprot:Gb_30767 [translate_table: standard]
MHSILLLHFMSSKRQRKRIPERRKKIKFDFSLSRVSGFYFYLTCSATILTYGHVMKMILRFIYEHIATSIVLGDDTCKSRDIE